MSSWINLICLSSPFFAFGALFADLLTPITTSLFIYLLLCTLHLSFFTKTNFAGRISSNKHGLFKLSSRWLCVRHRKLWVFECWIVLDGVGWSWMALALVLRPRVPGLFVRWRAITQMLIFIMHILRFFLPKLFNRRQSRKILDRKIFYNYETGKWKFLNF